VHTGYIDNNNKQTQQTIIEEETIMLTLKQAIDRLMRNDRNATWDECETIEELREGLVCAIENCDDEAEDFYKSIYESVWEVAQ
jgi:hypothetical protein